MKKLYLYTITYEKASWDEQREFFSIEIVANSKRDAIIRLINICIENKKSIKWWILESIEEEELSESKIDDILNNAMRWQEGYEYLDLDLYL